MRTEGIRAPGGVRFETWAAICAPLLLAAVILIALGQNDLDGRISDLFFDASDGSWPWKHGFWSQDVVHIAGGYLMIAGATAVLGVALAAGRVPGVALRWRWPAVYFIVAYLIAVGLISILKSNSTVPCAWHAIRYGGERVHDEMFRFVPGGIRHGRCFPGGHASGGFAWMASYWALRSWSRRAAWIALGLGLALGGIFSAGQVARGAHFSSHNAWSLVIVWTLCVLVYFACPAGRLWRNVNRDRTPS